MRYHSGPGASPLAGWGWRVLVGLIPVGVAAAWIPLRDELPNTDAALLLVITVAAIGTVAGRPSAVIGSLASVTAFDFFDTAPYGRLLIARTSDVVTAVVLLLAGLLVGGLAAGRRRYRQAANSGQEDFTVMASAARLLALGEEAGLVVSALAGELVSRLDLLDCRFVPVPPEGRHPRIERDGSLSGHPAAPGTGELELPIWVGDQAVAHYLLTLRGLGRPAPDRLVAAVGIGEQAGAALASSVGTGPGRPAGPPGRRLRVVR